jgi:hypothetical protein
MTPDGPGRGASAAVSFAAALLLLLLAAPGAFADDFTVRVEGRILRKATGKLVFSLSAFELGGAKEVVVRNRKTGETRVVPVSAAYNDISYSETLADAELAAFGGGDWIATVDWRVPRTEQALNRRLYEVHKEQNRLRRELGSALTEGGDPSVKVSSRITLNKLEKFHRVGTLLAREILRVHGGNLEVNPFESPVRVEIGFNPFGGGSPASKGDPLTQVKEVLYWEVHRILTQQFGAREAEVDFVYDSPATVRAIVPPPGTDDAGRDGFVPAVTLSPVAVDTAVYLAHQRIGDEAQKYVRLRMFKAPFITDRVLLDSFVNTGSVVYVSETEAALSFVPPFARAGDVFHVDPEDGKGEIPVVVATVRELEGVSVSAPLPAEWISRVKPGMVARRK